MNKNGVKATRWERHIIAMGSKNLMMKWIQDSGYAAAKAGKPEIPESLKSDKENGWHIRLKGRPEYEQSWINGVNLANTGKK